MYNLIDKAEILVIDDFAGFRQTIKTMLLRLGAQQIDQASNGQDAIKKCLEKKYDIIFCDYNLGEGQDGQQILEELHHRNLLRPGSLFLMVTAESTRAQVMGAIEYRPDAYLTKPFTGEQLGQRLKRLATRNKIMQPIYDAQNSGQPDRVIELCDQVMAQVPKVKYSCLRIKAEQLEKLGKSAEAREMYEHISADQPVLWALIGIGRIDFQQGKVQQALQHFEEIRQNFSEQVSVLDWIARCQQTLGDLEQAEQTLLKAVEVSPKSVSRQASLGAVARQLQHTETAQKAFSKTIHEGHYSCKLQPEYYREYYDQTRQLAADASGRSLSRLVAETEAMAKRMERKFHNDPSALAANLGSAARLFSSLGKADKSQQLIKQLASAVQNPRCKLDAKDLQYLDETLKALPESSDSLRKTIEQIDQSLQQIRLEVEKQSEISPAEQAREFNRQGLQMARQKRPKEALSLFRQAIDCAIDKTNYCLNAAQIIIEHPALNCDSELLQQARHYLTELIQLEPQDVRQKRYHKLLSALDQRQQSHA